MIRLPRSTNLLVKVCAFICVVFFIGTASIFYWSSTRTTVAEKSTSAPKERRGVADLPERINTAPDKGPRLSAIRDRDLDQKHGEPFVLIERPLSTAINHKAHREAISVTAIDKAQLGRELVKDVRSSAASRSLAPLLAVQPADLLRGSVAVSYFPSPKSRPVALEAAMVDHGESASSSASVEVRFGDGLINVLKNLGLTQADLNSLLPAIAETTAETLYPSEVVGVWWAKDGRHADRRHIEQVSIFDGRTERIRFTRQTSGAFRSETEIEVAAKIPPRPVTLAEALSLELMASGVKQSDVADLLFALWDQIDLTKIVTSDDEMQAVLESEPSSSRIMPVYLKLATDGRTFETFRFSPKGTKPDYFDRTGRRLGGGFIDKPMEFGRLTSAFGARRHPLENGQRFHAGLDLAAPRGTAVVAAREGRVTRAGTTSGYGKMVEVSHDGGWTSRYAHMDAVRDDLEPGDIVRKGQVIGYVGSTGLSTGAHLHYEIRNGGKPINPKEAVGEPSQLSRLDMANFKKRVAKIDDFRASPTLLANTNFVHI